MPRTPPVQIPIRADDRTRQAFASAQGRLDGLVGSGGRLAGLFRGGGPIAAGIATAVTSMGLLAAAAARASSQMQLLETRAQGLGTSATELQRFQRSARAIAGTDFEQSFDALETFAERVGEAYSETDSQIARVFRTLRVSVRGANGEVRPAIEVMEDYRRAIARLPNEQANFYLAEFGDVVRDTIGPLARNSEALEDYRRRLDEVARTSPELAATAAQADSSFKLIGDAAAAAADNWGNFLATVLDESGILDSAAESLGALADAAVSASDNMDDIFDRRENEGLLDQMEDLRASIAAWQEQLEREPRQSVVDDLNTAIMEAETNLARLQRQLDSVTRVQEAQRGIPFGLPAVAGVSTVATPAAPDPLATQDQERFEEAQRQAERRREIQQAEIAGDRERAELLRVALGLNVEITDQNRASLEAIAAVNIATKEIADNHKESLDAQREKLRVEEREAQLAEQAFEREQQRIMQVQEGIESTIESYTRQNELQALINEGKEEEARLLQAQIILGEDANEQQIQRLATELEIADAMRMETETLGETESAAQNVLVVLRNWENSLDGFLSLTLRAIQAWARFQDAGGEGGFGGFLRSFAGGGGSGFSGFAGTPSIPPGPSGQGGVSGQQGMFDELGDVGNGIGLNIPSMTGGASPGGSGTTVRQYNLAINGQDLSNQFNASAYENGASLLGIMEQMTSGE